MFINNLEKVRAQNIKIYNQATILNLQILKSCILLTKNEYMNISPKFSIGKYLQSIWKCNTTLVISTEVLDKIQPLSVQQFL